MARVGVIGLGNIGGAVAANLVADGHEVAVADIDPARAAAVDGRHRRRRRRRGRGERDHAHVPADARRSWPAVASAWAAAAPAGAILLDLSTTSPAGNRALAEHAGGDRPPLRRGAAHRRRDRRPEPGAGLHGRRRRRARRPLPADARPAGAGHVPPRAGRRRHHHEAGEQPPRLHLHLGVARGAVAGGRRRARPAHRGRGRPHRRGVTNFFIDRGVEGINTRGEPPEFTLDAGRQGRPPDRRDRRGAGRPGAGRRRRAAACWPTPSPGASATTTGATSSSPPRRGRRRAAPAHAGGPG